MKTKHKIIFGNANNINLLSSNSIDLMITSPPYPMIEMWDSVFSKQNHEIKNALSEKNGLLAFELIHKELDNVWDEAYRLLKDGGIACINIGDATRTIDGNFQLFSNHTRILQHCLKIGFYSLPAIIWRKQTNAPNKFMGSGMLPVGAYVTLEHEFILILRKGRKREFKSPIEKSKRMQSSFFWEERNAWFSDVWFDIKGTAQKLGSESLRNRNAAFPFELAYRLINMFSVKEDTVLDPCLGTGTTMIAAMASGRNSVGVEIERDFKEVIIDRTADLVRFSNEYIRDRLTKHIKFVKERIETKGILKYKNKSYHFPVMSRQEVDIVFNDLKTIKQSENNCFEVSYTDLLQDGFAKK